MLVYQRVFEIGICRVCRVFFLSFLFKLFMVGIPCAGEEQKRRVFGDRI